MRDVRQNRRRADLLQRRCRIAQRSRRIDNVVDDDAAPALDIADDVENLGIARPFAPLIDDREVRVKPFGDRARTMPPASGDTMTKSSPLKFSSMSLAKTGPANRLSTGMSKKP